MKRKISLLLSLVMILTFALCAIPAHAATNPITISTTKTTFQQGEDIVITFTNDYEGLTGSDLRLDNGDQDPETYPANRKSSLWCPVMDDIKAAGTYTMKTDKDRFGNTIAPGTYTLWVMCYNPLKIVSNKILITIEGKPATTVSVAKTNFAVGEPIEVSFTSFEGYKDPEIRIDAGHGLDKNNYPPVRKSSIDYVLCSDHMSAGKATFPKDGKRNVTTIPQGEYTIWVMNYTPLGIISNQIEITVGDIPQFSIKSATVQEGKSVSFDFKNISANLGSNVELRIYTVDKQTIGKDASLMYFKLTDAQGALTRGASGTVKFPADDARGNKTLPAGDYVAFLLDGQNHQIAEKIEFKVQAGNVGTGDFELFGFAALVIVMAGSLVVIMKKKEVYGK